MLVLAGVVHSLHSSLYEATLCICAETGVDNTGTFSLFLGRQSQDFLLLLTPPVSRLGAHKELGGDTAGTVHPNCPKGYSVPYSAQHIKLVEEERARGIQSYSSCQSNV